MEKALEDKISHIKLANFEDFCLPAEVSEHSDWLKFSIFASSPTIIDSTHRIVQGFAPGVITPIN